MRKGDKELNKLLKAPLAPSGACGRDCAAHETRLMLSAAAGVAAYDPLQPAVPRRSAGVREEGVGDCGQHVQEMQAAALVRVRAPNCGQVSDQQREP